MQSFYIQIQVLDSQKQKALSLVTENNRQISDSIAFYTKIETIDHVPVAILSFDQLIPYGIVDLSSFKEEGIACTKIMNNENDPKMEIRSLRFNESGEVVQTSERYRDRWISDVSIKNWLEKFGDTDPSVFVEILREMIKSNEQVFDPLSWTYQEEYGRRYRTRRLIDHGTK